MYFNILLLRKQEEKKGKTFYSLCYCCSCRLCMRLSCRKLRNEKWGIVQKSTATHTANVIVCVCWCFLRFHKYNELKWASQILEMKVNFGFLTFPLLRDSSVLVFSLLFFFAWKRFIVNLPVWSLLPAEWFSEV